MNENGATWLAQNYRKFFPIKSLGNVGTLTVDAILSNALNETISQVFNHLKKRDKDSPFSKVRKYTLEYPKSITLGHFNVNSLRNKFVPIEEFIKTKLDIFLVFETKIDQIFPNQQFSINGYKVYRKDRNCFGGGVSSNMNENIPCRELSAAQIVSNFETIFGCWTKYMLDWNLGQNICGHFHILAKYSFTTSEAPILNL